MFSTTIIILLAIKRDSRLIGRTVGSTRSTDLMRLTKNGSFPLPVRLPQQVGWYDANLEQTLTSLGEHLRSVCERQHWDEALSFTGMLFDRTMVNKLKAQA